MLIALPEIDGATNPTVFAGRHGEGGCAGCSHACASVSDCRAMAPCHERIESLAEKTLRLARLRRKANAEKKVAVVLFGFPPNAGAVGTAAYLSVFESLHNTLHEMKRQGYDLVPPATVDDLRAAVLNGNAAQYGQAANVAAYVDADTIVRTTPPLKAIEAVWGPAPGRIQSDGKGVFVLGAQFGNVFVGVQPTFGYEGDPMRLLFERGFAPTHAFSTFYLWLRNTFGADVVLHFGMHGALEFMPGKQAGLGARDWPDRLIGEMPNVYLYASNNPSEATLAKRRSNAVTVTHLTPPLATSGLYKGLLELKDSLTRWRGLDPDAAEPGRAGRADPRPGRGGGSGRRRPGHALADAARDRRRADPGWPARRGPPDRRGGDRASISTVHGRPGAGHARARGRASAAPADRAARRCCARCRRRFVAPVPGGDLIRSPEVLPTGRNIHAFDPVPDAHRLRAAATARSRRSCCSRPTTTVPRTVALVLWGSDNIKSDGVPIAQALALMGAGRGSTATAGSAARTSFRSPNSGAPASTW